ncbi:uroporphyrinogen-III C-methyltransferase [Pantoea agglomerans]|uniref:uroporphyrinogen-III C-methyltransferase n=1 Tax=Enterobacter agglomerans TaxID=549 RepID=UPI00104A2055|nr:uroporphyrinogen-III C-methyltransferase [Pantoea agglomerans]TCZ32115.1 uroporphyrinogen-III C-methyltransferase [Pantoea agglomerans]
MTRAIDSLDKLLAPVDAVSQQGTVWLVGAGPGDVELLTVKALRLLQRAEVVVYDRLVSDAVMAEVPEQALCIDVGKQPGQHGLKQAQINQLLVELARSGRNVIRLKGGDPFVFGRGGEEMVSVQQAGIRCEVVPGITAAVGCAAASGIPLTHRDCAQSLRLITGHGRNGEPQLEAAALTAVNQTLVFYMGLSWSASISAQLQAQGRDAETPVAIIENGTRPDQRVLITTLGGLAETVARDKPVSPSLLMVGEVVRFYRADLQVRGGETVSRCVVQERPA